MNDETGTVRACQPSTRGVTPPVPLLASKLHVPRPRGALVARPRLGKRLGTAATLTLVSAPAGFGKTTLLAERAGGRRSRRQSVAWLSLDRSDNDPLFWTYVVAALTVRPRSRCPRPATAPVADRAGLLNEMRRLTARCRAGARRLPRHRLPEMHDGDGFLLEHLPAAVAPGDRHPRRSAAAAGPVAGARRARRDPGRRPAVHRRRGRRRTSTSHGSGPDRGGRGRAGAADRGLDRRPAAGRPLAAGARRTPPASSPASPATTGTSSTTSPRRCCSGNPSASGTSCCDTAILDRLSGPLCDAVTGRDDGSADARRRWNGPTCSSSRSTTSATWYRYHHLFADVLRARLLGEQPNLVPCCTGGPAAGTSAHDRTEDAVSHALAAARHRPGGASDGAGAAGDAAHPAGRDAARLAAGSCPPTWSGAAPC